MSPLLVFSVLVALLFGGAYLTKRRFGVLGLALAGGSLLAELWGVAGGLLFAAEDIHIGVLSPENLALVVVTLLPALLLLLHGPSYHGPLQRLGASLLFTLLALALVIHPIQPLLAGSGAGMAIYSHIMQSRELIISAGLVAAFVDIFFTKASAHSKSGPKH
jgi:hypothetical protein